MEAEAAICRVLLLEVRAADEQLVSAAHCIRSLEAALDGAWSGVVNVVNDEPIRLRDLVERSLQRQGLTPVRWLGEDGPDSTGRRIRNTRLKQLGYRLHHPTLDQSGVLAANQVP